MFVLIIQVLRKKICDLRLGVGRSYKYLDKKYNNVLGFGITYLLMNLLSCQGFLKNNDSIVILKYPNSMFKYYLDYALARNSG